ncbi:excinuclease ABC subunit UvrC [Odoribacter sp. Z80]|uniref:excinuclease ABC subunit UvrC n=1 Tax=Odoribacter sp. Z80 TaxID=2304575 RepID=UPI001379CC1F|nr:excinuclease ABC subunit UvrC [Odoribacter sp. Z80]NCE72250.1 excinuclease ABC subunit C [Odoribacter sp. Z80]
MALYDEYLRKKVNELPDNPGVYQYFDSSGVIIYIGKAKNLKKRVLSYLNKSNQSSKTHLLVNKIADLRYIVVNSEQDALLLENNLIKKYKPKYNILLKDDKSYPWICIKKEPFPRVFITRRYIRDGSEYFGPYTSGKFAHVLINLIKSLFKLRTCNLALNEKAIQVGKFKVCLEYHIGNCKAPCVGRIGQLEYDEYIVQIRNILKGNLSSVIEAMTAKMIFYANSLKFEEANLMKEALQAVKNYQAKSTIVRTTISDTDVFSYTEDEKYAYINYLRILHGAVVQVHTVELEKKIEEEKESLLAFAIYEIRQMMDSHSKEIIVPFYPDIQLEGIDYVVPQRGDKKQLLELSERNASYFRLDRERQRSTKTKENNTFNLLKTIKLELKLPELPHRIECFDNSNIQGTNPVASCVVFLDGKPAKREYRKFHVKTVIGADDFASMEEIIYRRYRRVLDEGLELTNLIVIDGGKGQLHSAVNSLKKLGLYGKVSILGLAKQMEEIYFPEDQQPYLLAKNSVALKTLMHIRDEAHRFGITFHRRLREKNQINSVISQIKGIGNNTEISLLQEFKSVENIMKQSIPELAKIIGTKRAELVYNYFHGSVE